MHKVLVRCLTAIALYGGGTSLVSAQQPEDAGGTRIIAQDDARFDEGPWGKIWVYDEGDTGPTHYSFAARIELAPGQEVHPPHVHAEEEYLLVISGEGTWTINDETMPARAGNLLYSAPWDNHGIVNGPDGKMVIFVWKWMPEEAAGADHEHSEQ